jgi:dGTPase
MPQTREMLELEEISRLAPVAQCSGRSRGRAFEEYPAPWRTHFQRDRDRIIHSKAFRRLEYKTQVFLNGAGDHYRTRLTHTIEVAAVSRSIAQALKLNESLAEAIALAHDLGHSPFGHQGERVLDQLMKSKGGFEHNRQSLRIVETLEQKYPDFPGLNLSWEVREGLKKHDRQTSPCAPVKELDFKILSASLEAQIANLADEITYYNHDLDDGLEAGLIHEEDLRQEVGLWQEAESEALSKHPDCQDREGRRYYIIRCLMDAQIRDVVMTSERLIEVSKAESADDVLKHPSALINYSLGRKKDNQVLRRYLFENLYLNPAVQEPNNRATRMLSDLFEYYLKHPSEIGASSRKRADIIGVDRAVCDYLAGMTDRYVIQEYRRIFNESPWPSNDLFSAPKSL